MANLIGLNVLGNKFVQDPKPDWAKIDGVGIGESFQFGYNSYQNTSIGNLLDQLSLDGNVVVVIYEWNTGKAYAKKGFDLTVKNDSKSLPDFSSFVYKKRVTQNMITGNVVPVIPPQPTPSQKKICSPFIDVCNWPPFDMLGCSQKTGNKFFSLAFIIADNAGNPSFGGAYPLNSNWFLDKITALRNLGGDVIISFGGAAGSELATVTYDVNSLVSKYQSVIDLYSLKIISFDIEGSSITDTNSIDRRNKALAILQKKNPNLKINYVLPVMPDGLDWNGINLVKNAKDNGVSLFCVELMTMDYGQNNKQMGQAAITACKCTRSQLIQNGYPNTKIGIIPMIGKNDTGEVFTLQNAVEVSNFAKNTDYIYNTSYWSIARDTYQGVDDQGPLYNHSGVQQSDFQFLKSFL